MTKKFRCLVCGYIHEGEMAPEECPLCHVGSDQFEEIDRDMEAFYRRHWDFWRTALVEYAARLLEAAEFFLIFLFLELEVPFIYCVVALSCASLVGNLFAFIPMQIGTREMGLALAMSWVNLASPMSLTASIMSRIRELIYTAAGTLMMLVRDGELPLPTREEAMDALDIPVESNVDWEPPIAEGDWQPGMTIDITPDADAESPAEEEAEQA